MRYDLNKRIVDTYAGRFARKTGSSQLVIPISVSFNCVGTMHGTRFGLRITHSHRRRNARDMKGKLTRTDLPVCTISNRTIKDVCRMEITR